MNQTRRNPWGLTKREGDALTALIEHGNGKAAGKALGVIDKTVEGFVNKAKKRMKLESRVQMAVHWDRWMRSPDYVEDQEPPNFVGSILGMISRGEATDLDALVARCGRTRQHVKFSVRNLVADSRIHRVGWVQGQNGRRMGVYAAGPGPKREPKPKRTFSPPVGSRPVNSVFQLGGAA